MKTLKENLLRNVGVGRIKLIEDWLQENVKIQGSYEIKKDFTIDVRGSVRVHVFVKEIPEYIQFDYVSRVFDCRGCENLVSLKGGPVECQDLWCDGCKSLKSLKDGPKKVYIDYALSYCDSLTNLEGSSEWIRGSFRCSHCKNLTSLKGAPKDVRGSFECSDCPKLKSLEGLPSYVSGNIYCENCGVKFNQDDVRKMCEHAKWIYV